jgi:hypothetical protein
MKRQNKRAQKNKKRDRSRAKDLTTIKTVENYFALPKRAREVVIGVANTVSAMRSTGGSLSKTALECGVSRQTVIRLGGSALRKLNNGRYAAKDHDRLLRVLVVVAKGKGLLEVATRDSRQASKAGRHSAAIQRYLETGDDSGFAQFKSKYIIDARGKRIALLTNLDELDRLGSAGVLAFESLYARSL